MFSNFKFWVDSNVENQFLATVVINLLTVAHGLVIGWTSPTIPYLKSPQTHLKTGPITTHQASWIGSYHLLGSAFTTFTIKFLSNKIGEKITLLLLVVPNLISWTIIFLSTQVWHLYTARIIAGLTSGGLYTIIPIFTGKIAESRVRGALGSIFPLSLILGNLLMYILAGYLKFHIPPLIAMTLPVIFFFGLLFLPETPHFHLSRNEREKALKSLMFYRNCEVKNDLIEEELKTFEKSLKNIQKEKVGVKDFVSHEGLRSLLMIIFLALIGPFAGVYTTAAYTADIFINSGSSLSPNLSSIIVCAIQLFGVYTATLTTDKYGRKFLMSISCFGTFLFLFIMATYDFMIDREIIENSISLNWIPIVSLSMAVFVMSLGIASIPFVMVTEVVDHKIRDASVMIFMGLLIVFSFLSLKLYYAATPLRWVFLSQIFPPLLELIHLYGCMFFYSGICLIASLISIFLLPETKGKKLFESSTNKE